MDEFNNKKPPTPLLISYDPELLRKQAADSTRRFEEGQAFPDLDASCFLNNRLCACSYNVHKGLILI